MRELRPGLWHWQAPHPQWRPTEPWSENVSSYALDDGERLLLVERDAQSLVERLGVAVYPPLPDTAQDLMDMYGVTAEQAGDAVPTSSGCSARREARHARTRPATGCRSAPTCLPGTSGPTPCSG